MSDTGWIGVDLDGTLAHYEGWDEGKVGEIIPRMKLRIIKWLSEGITVKIFTARVCNGDFDNQTEVIQNWLEENSLPRLDVTNSKDYGMMELWDDRAVQVVPNTGKTIEESLQKSTIVYD